MLAAMVWHFWIAVVLVLAAVIPSTVGLIAMYLKKTQAPRYGGDE